MQQFNEGLKAGDLEGVVSKRFSIDQYKSKMGEDRNIMVLAFTVEGQAPAKDLERFAEVGYKYKVFVEFERKPEVVTHILSFLEDLKKLTNIEEFEYTYHKNDNATLVSTGNMSEAIPTTPEAYEMRVNEMKVGEAKNFFDKYDMMECKFNENILSVKKSGAGQELQFEINKFGPTEEIMKEAKAFAIDMDSIAECTYLTKYFGPYNITKTTESRFIFSKDGQSALLTRQN